jgi:hypothetical protein
MSAPLRYNGQGIWTRRFSAILYLDNKHSSFDIPHFKRFRCYLLTSSKEQAHQRVEHASANNRPPYVEYHLFSDTTLDCEELVENYLGGA